MSAPDWLTAQPIAHRGLHGPGIPENSLAAAAAAIAGGYAIETDVRPAADGTAMVFHDETLERLTGEAGRVDERQPGELGELRLGSTGEAIPTLGDLLRAVAGAVPLVIEIKAPGAAERAFAARVAAQVRAYRGPAALMSFEPASLRACALAAPEVPRGLISYRWDDDRARRRFGPFMRWARRNLIAAPATRARFIAYDARALPAAAPALARAVSLPLLSWTVRDAGEARRLERHVDQIIFEGFRP